MYIKMRFVLVLFLMFSMQLSAEERLTSRFLNFTNDPQCFVWTSFAWEKKQIVNNRAVLRYTTENNLFYRYKPNFKGLEGTAEVFIYKHTTNAVLDTKVLEEFAHAGKIDTVHVDFNTTRDQ